MSNPVAATREIDDNGHLYTALVFICPGCEDGASPDVEYKGGLHMLPVSGDVPYWRPRWEWDGNLEAPTLSPSVLSRFHRGDTEVVCHSFLRGGVFEYLTDSTHAFAGQQVPLPSLPDFMMKD